MKNNKNLIWVFPLILLAVSSCYEAPEFPVVPEIAYKSVKFYDVPESNDPLVDDTDSLVVTIDFQDGDGDLGLGSLSNEELSFPYHSHYYVTTDNRLVITPPANAKLLGPSSNDTMPPFNVCVDYQLAKIHETTGKVIPYRVGGSEKTEYEKAFPDPNNPDGSLLPDTFYIKQNIFAYNFLLTFLEKNGNNYEIFDWNAQTAAGCANQVNGTFPPLYEEGAVGNPLSGELSYSFPSRGFIPYFRNDTIKLRIQIIDRALHTSNIVESPPFYFVEQANKTYQIRFIEE